MPRTVKRSEMSPQALQPLATGGDKKLKEQDIYCRGNARVSQGVIKLFPMGFLYFQSRKPKSPPGDPPKIKKTWQNPEPAAIALRMNV